MKYYWMNYKTYLVDTQVIHESSDITTTHPFLVTIGKNQLSEGKEINVLSNWKEITKEEYEMIAIPATDIKGEGEE